MRKLVFPDLSVALSSSCLFICYRAIVKSRDTGMTEAMTDNRTTDEPEVKSKSTSPITMGFDIKPLSDTPNRTKG